VDVLFVFVFGFNFNFNIMWTHRSFFSVLYIFLHYKQLNLMFSRYTIFFKSRKVIILSQRRWVS
jgi:hypothetical protein